MKKNTIAKTKEEYVAFVKNEDSGEYVWLNETQARTLEGVKKCFERQRKEWERYLTNLDYNDVQFRHRTVTYTEWEVVG